MNYTDIIDHLVSKGFDAKCGQYNNEACLQIDITIDDHTYTLKHLHIKEVSSLPRFFLDDAHDKAGLAHILPVSTKSVAGICVTIDDAVSVNFEAPKLAFAESLQRHIELLDKALSDPAWNTSELVREFAANWSLICENSGLDFICAASRKDIQPLLVKSAVTGGKSGFDGSTIGLSADAKHLGEYSYVKRQFEKGLRKRSGAGLIIPLGKLSAPPKSASDVCTWYLNALGQLSESERDVVVDCLKGVRERTFWLVFNGDTDSGTAWFGVKLDTDCKKYLPIDKASVASWTAKPVRIKVFNPEGMLPRGGARQGLMDKRVLLVGCGSVGGELAFKLGASGIGELTLSDPDIYGWENVYRHVLSDYSVGSPKSISLAFALESKYPWLKAEWSTRKLLDFRDEAVLNAFDLIVIAIGSPTHERLFADYLGSLIKRPPIINTWLEGHSVGGHATLSLPNKKGCLLCAFVDNNCFTRGLTSNLSFIAPNQNLTTNIAGCGDLFLPFSSIDASKTANIAAELAVQYLIGKVDDSCSISWKGDDFEAIEHKVELTHRYYNFSESHTKIPLYHEGCDICEE